MQYGNSRIALRVVLHKAYNRLLPAVVTMIILTTSFSNFAAVAEV